MFANDWNENNIIKTITFKNVWCTFFSTMIICHLENFWSALFWNFSVHLWKKNFSSQEFPFSLSRLWRGSNHSKQAIVSFVCTTFEFILEKGANLVFINHKSTNKSPNTIILGQKSAYHWHSKTRFSQCWSHINNSEAREGAEVP